MKHHLTLTVTKASNPTVAKTILKSIKNPSPQTFRSWKTKIKTDILSGAVALEITFETKDTSVRYSRHSAMDTAG